MVTSNSVNPDLHVQYHTKAESESVPPPHSRQSQVLIKNTGGYCTYLVWRHIWHSRWWKRTTHGGRWWWHLAWWPNSTRWWWGRLLIRRLSWWQWDAWHSWWKHSSWWEARWWHHSWWGHTCVWWYNDIWNSQKIITGVCGHHIGQGISRHRN